MSAFLWIVTVTLVIVWVITVVDIVRRHLGTMATAAWLLIVVLIPFLGAIAYWALRKPTDAELDAQRGAEGDLRRQPPREPFGGSHGI